MQRLLAMNTGQTPCSAAGGLTIRAAPFTNDPANWQFIRCAARSGSEDWKKCKYVGSLLGTREDINRIIGLTCGAHNTLKSILTSLSKKVSFELILIFCALLESIFFFRACAEVCPGSFVGDTVRSYQLKLIIHVLV